MKLLPNNIVIKSKRYVIIKQVVVSIFFKKILRHAENRYQQEKILLQFVLLRIFCFFFRSKSVLKLKILHENDIATYTCVSNYRHYQKTFQLKIPSNGKFRKNKRKYYNFTYTLFRNRGGLCLMKSPKNMCQNLPYLWIKKTQIVFIILNQIEFLTKPLISEDCWVS